MRDRFQVEDAERRQMLTSRDRKALSYAVMAKDRAISDVTGCGPVVETPSSPCRGHGFGTPAGESIPACHSSLKTKRTQNTLKSLGRSGLWKPH